MLSDAGLTRIPVLVFVFGFGAGSSAVFPAQGDPIYVFAEKRWRSLRSYMPFATCSLMIASRTFPAAAHGGCIRGGAVESGEKVGERVDRPQTGDKSERETDATM